MHELQLLKSVVLLLNELLDDVHQLEQLSQQELVAAVFCHINYSYTVPS